MVHVCRLRSAHSSDYLKYWVEYRGNVLLFSMGRHPQRCPWLHAARRPSKKKHLDGPDVALAAQIRGHHAVKRRRCCWSERCGAEVGTDQYSLQHRQSSQTVQRGAQVTAGRGEQARCEGCHSRRRCSSEFRRLQRSRCSTVKPRSKGTKKCQQPLLMDIRHDSEHEMPALFIRSTPR